MNTHVNELPTTHKPLVDYYKKHNISPVRRDISDIDKHYQRRDSLLIHLGIVPSLLAGKSVIEFGPGTGHHAIHINNLKPSRYVLVDGNPKGLEQAQILLKEYTDGIDNIEIHESLIEEFTSDEKFDLVICESVIPWQKQPTQFLKHVAGFVKPGGILLITCEDSVSYLSEVLWRLVGTMLIEPGDSVETQLDKLRPAFAKPLSTLKGMNRPLDDWLLDDIIQPFVGDLMSIEDAIEALKGDFNTYSSSPRFTSDWRWYKNIFGENNYNQLAIDIYYQNIHNFIDYRFDFEPRPVEENKKLLALCDALFTLEQSFEVSRDMDVLAQIHQLLTEINGYIRQYGKQTAESVDGFLAAIEYFQEHHTLESLDDIAPFFGRSQQHLSFVRNSGQR